MAHDVVEAVGLALRRGLAPTQTCRYRMACPAKARSVTPAPVTTDRRGVASPTWDAEVPCHFLFEFNPQLGNQRRALRPHFVTAVVTSGNLADSI